ncbi:hypothetical protein LINPERHAP1_LOCUS35841, partial [Linum perenne]
WRPPARGRLKINVDGAIRRAQGGAIGFVLRDEAGSVLFVGGRSLPHFTDVFTVEAFAVREALRWCIGRSMIHMDIEGDAAMVTNHILNKKLLHPRAGVIIQECKLLLARWRPPARGRLKINVDGAIRRAQGGAIGFVLRDEAGSVLFAGGRSLPHFTDVFTVEAFAVREALRWCISRSMIHMDIEGDVAMVTNHILNKKLLHLRAGVIIQECKLLLARYPSIRCLSVRREANTSAHNVARQALTMLPLRSQLLNLTFFACSNLH